MMQKKKKKMHFLKNGVFVMCKNDNHECDMTCMLDRLIKMVCSKIMLFSNKYMYKNALTNMHVFEKWSICTKMAWNRHEYAIFQDNIRDTCVFED